MTYDLVMDGGNWWVFDVNTRSFDHSFEIDEIRGIVNDDRNMETWTAPKVISLKDWDGNEHWMVAWEYSDGELAKVKQFPTKEEAEKWLIEFN